jgi:hypothetical protein
MTGEVMPGPMVWRQTSSMPESVCRETETEPFDAADRDHMDRRIEAAGVDEFGDEFGEALLIVRAHGLWL